MQYTGRVDQRRFNRMDVLVLPDEDDRVKDLEPGHIGSDGVRFYVSETLWARIKDQLLTVGRPVR